MTEHDQRCHRCGKRSASRDAVRSVMVILGFIVALAFADIVISAIAETPWAIPGSALIAIAGMIALDWLRLGE